MSKRTPNATLPSDQISFSQPFTYHSVCDDTHSESSTPQAEDTPNLPIRLDMNEKNAN